MSYPHPVHDNRVADHEQSSGQSSPPVSARGDAGTSSGQREEDQDDQPGGRRGPEHLAQHLGGDPKRHRIQSRTGQSINTRGEGLVGSAHPVQQQQISATHPGHNNSQADDQAPDGRLKGDPCPHGLGGDPRWAALRTARTTGWVASAS